MSGQPPVVNYYYDSIIHVDGNVDADMMDRITALGLAIIKDRKFQNKMIDTVTKEYARDFKKRY